MSAIVRRKLPLSEPIDLLLADVAVRIQLSPTQYSLAVSRYRAINDWIERDGSPLKDLVILFYPQGSMAIGATVASKVESDEFDIDLIAHLAFPTNAMPNEILNILEAAIRGEKGSRYYDKVVRCSRCIQVQYADGMHLDVTPMVRLEGLPERIGHIFHSKEKWAHPDDKRIIANPFGFAEWFKAKTPADREFSIAFATRERLYETAIVLAKAEAEPVPEQEPAHEKSMAVIALQLIKRWRNIQYDGRQGRKPASVLLATMIGSHANQTETLSEELLYQARMMLSAFAEAQIRQQLIEVRNPACDTDVFTDRWPASLKEQGVFVDDLKKLIVKLEKLNAGTDLATMREIMSELFGEKPALEAIASFNQSTGRAISTGNAYHQPGTGRFDLGASSVIAAASPMPAAAAEVSRATPRHTHFGGDEDRW